MQILLAEDNPTNERVAIKLLRRLGHTSRTAHNGREVLEILRDDRGFDCILMDLQMPEMDGIEATRQIRAEFAATEIPPIIAVTANAFGTVRDTCLEAGMVDFLTKPLRLGVLEEALRGAAPAATASGADEIDIEHFDAIMCDGDPESIAIFEDFCSHTRQILRELEGLKNSEASEPFGKLAHQFKGSLATFGLAALSNRAGRLEEIANSGSLDAVEPDWAQQLLGEFEAAETILRERIASAS